MNTSQNVVAAFSEEQTARLTGVSPAQLKGWDRVGFYSPSYAEANRRLAFSRVYSFRDIVALRVLNVLRNQYGVSLAHLREVKEKLTNFEDNPWAGVSLFVVNKTVHWIDPDTSSPQEVMSGQYVVPTLLLDEMVENTKRDIQSLHKRRDSSNEGLIEKSRYVNHNANVISGTRIPVSAIKRFVEAGYRAEQILEEYPELTAKDVVAAIAYEDTRSAA